MIRCFREWTPLPMWACLICAALMWKVNEIAYLNNLLLVVAHLFYHVRDTVGQYVSVKAWFWCPENVLKFCNFYVLKKVKLLCSGLKK